MLSYPATYYDLKIYFKRVIKKFICLESGVKAIEDSFENIFFKKVCFLVIAIANVVVTLLFSQLFILDLGLVNKSLIDTS